VQLIPCSRFLRPVAVLYTSSLSTVVWSAPQAWSVYICGETTSCRAFCSGCQRSSWGTHFNSRGQHARARMMTLRCAFCAHAAATNAPSCANRIHIDNGNEDLFNFMTTLPEKETWVRCECARKRTADDTFVTRRCVCSHSYAHTGAANTWPCVCAHVIVTRVMHAPRLVITDQALFFAHESNDRVLDDVLLQEVCLLLGCISQPVSAHTHAS
jgi:hypothetical protein